MLRKQAPVPQRLRDARVCGDKAGTVVDLDGHVGFPYLKLPTEVAVGD